MSNTIKRADHAYTQLTSVRSERPSQEELLSDQLGVNRSPSSISEPAKPQSGDINNALERYQDKIATETIKDLPERTELESPLELLSVKVIAELKSTLEQIAPHEPQDRLITISLRALSRGNLETQVTRVSSSGVATELDLIGEGLGSDHFTINTISIRNSSVDDDQVSTEARAQSAIAKAAAINDSSRQTGVRAVALPTRTDTQESLNKELGGEVYGTVHPIRGFRPKDDARLMINQVDVNLKIYADRDATGSLRKAINAHSDRTGVIAEVNEEGALVLEAPDGRNISVQYEGSRGGALEDALGLRASGDHPYGGRIALVSFNEITLDLGREVNYALGDIAGDFSIMDENYYSQ